MHNVLNHTHTHTFSLSLSFLSLCELPSPHLIDAKEAAGDEVSKNTGKGDWQPHIVHLLPVLSTHQLIQSTSKFITHHRSLIVIMSFCQSMHLNQLSSYSNTISETINTVISLQFIMNNKIISVPVIFTAPFKRWPGWGDGGGGGGEGWSVCVH